ncbi:MAG: hypothetical protein L0H55_12925 [Candidatus Nitrosocosmicus sp.]|nr:hypothetical protein [Candidatus Nitrosocosmicus sp.]
MLQDGYGKNNSYFGSVNGLIINKPQEPVISFLEIVKRHLRTGYSEIWSLIAERNRKSEQTLAEIENIIEEFKNTIKSKVDIDFILEEKPNLGINEMKNTYQESLFVEIFNEINNIKNNLPRNLESTLKSIRKLDGMNSNNYYILYFTYTTHYPDKIYEDYFAIGKKEDVEKLKEIITDLLKSNELNNKVKEYDDKIEYFKEISNDDIYKKIKEIYDSTIQDPLNLKGKCALCPPHSWIDGF